MDDVTEVLFDVAAVCAILLCAVVTDLSLARRREAASHLSENRKRNGFDAL
jgi:hypothetical protein